MPCVTKYRHSTPLSILLHINECEVCKGQTATVTSTTPTKSSFLCHSDDDVTLPTPYLKTALYRYYRITCAPPIRLVYSLTSHGPESFPIVLSIMIVARAVVSYVRALVCVSVKSFSFFFSIFVYCFPENKRFFYRQN